MNNTYTCAHCRGTFEKGWSDEEAMKEKDRDYAQFPIEECALVCDDCYQKYNAWTKKERVVT